MWQFNLTGKDNKGALQEAQVVNRSNEAGLLVYSKPHLLLNQNPLAFINSSFGSAMNQNGGYSGIPYIIHNGETSSHWIASSSGAGTWNFANAGTITITNANDNTIAEFDEPTATPVDISGNVAFVMDVLLQEYESTSNDMLIGFTIGGLPNGIVLSVNNYMNPVSFAQQTVAIPLIDFELTGATIDGFFIDFARSGGARPAVTFDNIQFFPDGNALEYRIHKNNTRDYIITGLRIVLVDDITVIEHDRFMGLSGLANGITARQINFGKINFSFTMNTMLDLVSLGSTQTDHEQGATDLMVVYSLEFSSPILFTGTQEDNYLSVTINDDLTGLTAFQIVARGYEVIT